MHQAKERASRVKEKTKKILRLKDSHQKTPLGSVGQESASTAPNPQSHSETDSFGLSPKDSPPILIPDNQNSRVINNEPFKTARQQACQAPADPASNATSQSPPEQPSHHLREHDNQGSSPLVIGSLWIQAAESLVEEDREMLNRLLKLKQEDESADAPKDHGASLSPSSYGDGPPAAVSSVLSEARKCKGKAEKVTWKPVVDNIIEGVMKFKSLGDAVVKFVKSGYATLGWSVVSFGLQVASNEKEARKLALSSSELITEFITRYAQYEKWFRRSQPDKEFDCRLVKVY